MAEPVIDPAARRARRLATWSARTTRPLDVLAMVFLAALFVRWLLADRPRDEELRNLALYLGYAVWAAFIVDYFVRLALSVPRSVFVRTHKLDLLMVLVPFLRILRVLIIIVRSIRRIPTERVAASMVGIAGAVVTLGALVVWRYESVAPGSNIRTIGQAYWWAIVTTTTVGYGDEYPVTWQGRVVASVVMLVGVGLIGTVSASVASWFVGRRDATVDPPGGAPDAPGAGGGLDVPGLEARLDALAAEQVRIRELLERIAPGGERT
ncbi:MAG: potassium channel family protein [Actinomycetes bacterium]